MTKITTYHTYKIQKKHYYLPDPLQGLSERALGSALELLKSLPTATLLLCLHWGWSSLLTHLHTWRETGRQGQKARSLVEYDTYVCVSERDKIYVSSYVSLVNYTVIELLTLGGNVGHNWNRQEMGNKERKRESWYSSVCAKVTCLLSPGSVC